MTRNGFTLIELSVVLFIIGISSAVVGIILYGSLNSTILKTSAKEIASTLRYARSHAVSEKKTYFFILYKDEHGYQMELLAENADGEGISILHRPLAENITAKHEGDGWLRIDFFPRGDSTGGKIRLKNRNGSSFLITVEQVTGRVRIE